MKAEPDAKSPARVSEAAWAATSFIAFAAFGARTLSHDGLLWYASLTFTAIAMPLSAALLIRSLRNGTDSWSWASVALSLVTVTLIRLLA
ncbi:hypothetical protein [Thermomonospora umbrina]|uniref:Uncharacterized protein n=1 Tax=Thermomonospora umbrina TaxID=111806 RepID=A0A3D9SLB0_9ACTN|nr:hypothetical protein [Thermomonospora umbrina]REE96699.1 hypothetical protein DFJ69_2146 [Thermomonospora umbrina]